jgi:tetratricopeptide (TPR) repeat protein
MGIKQTDIHTFLEPNSLGFYYESARSFLNRHADPNVLLAQLKTMLRQGQLGACHDLIQLVLREGHDLGDHSALYLLRAEVAYFRGENLGEVMAWVQQARLCPVSNDELDLWEKLNQATTALKEGDAIQGQIDMEQLIADEGVVSHLAQFELSYHLFWKNIDAERALQMLSELTKEHPEFLQAWSCLGFAYNKFGMKIRAQQAFAQCLELDSNPDRLKIYKQQLAS